MSRLEELKAEAKRKREASSRVTTTEPPTVVEDEFANPLINTELAAEAKEETEQPIGNTSMPPPPENQGFMPLTVPIGQPGFSSVKASEGAEKKSEPRPATKIDLRNLTEADIMDMPFIKAKGFDIPAMLQATPKDPELRFRWVNWKNYDGGNYNMFLAMGFSLAKKEDVQGGVADNLIAEDGAIKFYDVVLMKINTLILMQHYKKNIVASQRMVNQWRTTAKDEAEKTLRNNVPADMLAAMKRAGLNVEFYNPTTTEMADQDKDFAAV